jgi:hypothetical protein
VEHVPVRRVVQLLAAVRGGRQDPKADHLAGHPLFARLGPRERAAVASLVDIVWVPAGKVLARQGLHPVETFVISRGRADVFLDGVPVACLDRNQTVGIAARYHRVPFGATVVTASDAELFVVQPRCLRTFVELVPSSVSPAWSDFSPAPVAPASPAASR